MAPQAPQSHKQPSRKGKRAWRKNIDINEVTTGLENARDEATLTGGQLLADVSQDALFQTDLAGSTEIQDRVRKSSHGHLKADDIIAARSKVPAVSSKKNAGDVRTLESVQDQVGSKRKRGGGVSQKELERLKQVAYGPPKELEVAETTIDHDPWAETSTEPTHSTSSYMEPPREVREPDTLRSAPIPHTASGKPVANVPRPNAGRSYNPDFQEWSTLLEREGQKEVQAEKKRLEAAERERERTERATAAAEEVEKQERDKETFGFSDYESDWEGIQSDMEETQLKARRPERKTPAERNKVKRRKAAEAQARHEIRMRQRDLQTKQIDAIRRTVDAKERALVSAGYKPWGGIDSDVPSSEGEEPDHPIRPRRQGKFAVPDAPLEVVLPDELEDSLRRLKPEGNLLKDRFRNLIVQGKLEGRRPVGQSKKPNRKATEKWSYKDWKLPSK
ncbi:MAG: hypothetical protein M1828_007411 [Chrysothrix sp. TS-e1954]|nr:MAG: hypothetical protein M1828_007411 [Chrysothrix sp. TS-e1954]